MYFASILPSSFIHYLPHDINENSYSGITQFNLRCKLWKFQKVLLIFKKNILRLGGVLPFLSESV